MTAKCPRCGEEMTGGICDNCGFPLTKMRRKYCKLKVKQFLKTAKDLKND